MFPLVMFFALKRKHTAKFLIKQSCKLVGRAEEQENNTAFGKVENR